MDTADDEGGQDHPPIQPVLVCTAKGQQADDPHPHPKVSFLLLSFQLILILCQGLLHSQANSTHSTAPNAPSMHLYTLGDIGAIVSWEPCPEGKHNCTVTILCFGYTSGHLYMYLADLWILTLDLIS